MKKHLTFSLCLTLILGVAWLAWSGLLSAREDAEPKQGPLSPQQAIGSFHVDPNFEVQLVAAEPDVIDPVSMCFDEKGRIFVCEMRGYPNKGVGTGEETRGRIKRLTDTNGDGQFDLTEIFAEGLRFPMGITPWKGGMIVAVAPDILYLEDTTGDGKADKSTVLYTGFNLANIQQMVNGILWTQDNWVYGIGGNNAGTITSPENPDFKPITLRSRGFRFRPDRPGSMEPTSGGGQYGITADDFGHWFTATNSQHLRQIVIPNHYLERNPSAPVTAVTADIPEHGASAKVFRASPFEKWRVERTTRRAKSEQADRFASTELVAGGYTSSSCSPIIYTADLFPEQYRGNSFVCDPGNNLIHRETIHPAGARFTARRAYPDQEFFASSDTWSRPVFQTIGPDGAIYVLDFYREVIETPLSLPDDIKAELNLESRNRGRIWRIVPKGYQPNKLPDLSVMNSKELVQKLTDGNSWVRLTSQRLLVERQAKEVTTEIAKLVESAKGTHHLPNLLYMLKEFDSLTDAQIELAMGDPLPGNREVGLRLAEGRFEQSAALRDKAVKLAADPEAMVRFQAALSAAYMPEAEASELLAKVLSQDVADPWVQSALLIAARGNLDRLVEASLDLPTDGNRRLAASPFVTKVAAMIGSGKEVQPAEKLAANILQRPANDLLANAALEGLATGLRTRGVQLANWLKTPPQGKQEISKALETRFAAASQIVADSSADNSNRLAAARLLAFAPFELAKKPLTDSITSLSAPDLQIAAIRALAAHPHGDVANSLVANWAQLGPGSRREIQEQLFSTPARLNAFLDAVKAGKVKAAEVDPARIAQLRNHPSAAIKERANSLFPAGGTGDRKKVIDAYKTALELEGDAKKGQEIFKTQCSSCHKIGDLGHEVGPNLLAAVPGKSGLEIIAAIYDPNLEVDPRYMNYLANTIDGKVVTGIIVADTPAAITLRRPDGSEDTIPRADLESLKSSGLSLMPEGLEKDITPQDTAHLLAFLKQITSIAEGKGK